MLVVDADSIAKGIYSKDKDVLVKLKRIFGKDIFNNEGNIIFRALAGKVFSDRSELKKLNDLMFPLLRKEIKNIINGAGSKQYIIIDAAVLFNSGLNQLCDFNILVNASMEARKNYIKNKDLPEKDIESRMKGQHIYIDHEKIDFTIENTGNLDGLQQQVKNILKVIELRSGSDQNAKK